ncbi:hypothetical protein BOO69_16240 [Sulfitobacter alexandrii]|uniref:Uncharacterized protein n=1 Tax=Sulfitobacter alexandrii TaxID=1917485 RepID=A0A1J0WK95_9RHOB|nr:hypothetical protein [Sulfitobacter alexandrii]APE44775.1 hypothetical protein BOO69_16240 [Sulfitobacter alexandrii]
MSRFCALWIAGIVGAALLGGAVARADGAVAMLDGCLRYLETGRLAELDGLTPVEVGEDGAVVECDSGLCGNPDVFLAGETPEGELPVLLRISAPMGAVSDTPDFVACGNATPGRFGDAAFGTLRAWAETQVADKRLGEPFLQTDTQATYLGCGWNGQHYNVTLLLDQTRGPVFMALLSGSGSTRCERDMS